jgi:hypothetical protein
MKFIQTSFILWVSLFLITGCAPKVYTINESCLIVIKTPKLKFADLGYIRRNADEVRADLFVAGQLVQSIEISTLICVDDGCISKSEFNKDYLHPSYPDDLILNVLLGRPIFEKASLQKTEGGFIQNIKSDEYNVVYKVEYGKTYFKDRQNRFLIKISKTKG